jgi:arylsulfatase A-like enzyme
MRCVLALALIGCGSSEPPAQPIEAPPAPVIVATTPAPKPVAKPAPKPARVVIISIDGLRPDMMTSELMPRHVQLMAEGTTARDAWTIQESDTLPSHAAMLSGVGMSAHGLSWNSYQSNRGYIKVPTVFTAARAAGLSTAMIVGKPKLKHIASPGTVDHYERPSYLCGGVAKRAAEYFVAEHPDLLFVHFSDPDEYGHSHGWTSPEYKRAARNSDRCLATVLAAIDGSKHRDDTLVIVTADHGGESKHHNGHDKQSRAIPWIARGPGVAAGASIDKPIDTVDTAATTLAALGLPRLPKMTGTSRLFTR